ncbi:response regulator [Jannaschia formosa]|uniref:response regulator n=1 Tax=Jannaschia formosa TaxID=2259592 RepID=UPI000E1BC285|nr:response regulator [Jannaschia formosa]TFL17245.1 response regulator [Jannaschia formosa]
MTAPEKLAGRRVLVVEDEIMVVMMVENILGDLGCETVAASNKARAFALLEKETFDAAILDVNLDGAESYDVADVLVLKGTPFMFSTGYGVDGLKPAYRHLPVLPKPFWEQELLRLISGLVGDA